MKINNNASNIDVKRINRNRIFRIINEHDRISRPEIANTLGISAPTVLMITNELLDRGVIRKYGEFESTGGRKAIALAPIHDYRYTVGLDITQNHISLALTNLSKKILKHVRIQKPFEFTNEYLLFVSQHIVDFITDMSIPNERVLGVGISLPGIIDDALQKITVSHLLDLHDIPYKNFSRFIPYPCAFVNDANAAAISEISNLNTESPSLYFSLSNSVGGAIISKDSITKRTNPDSGIWSAPFLYVGDHYKSGEIGHMTLYPNGKQCYCGQKGCFNAYCSAKVLSAHTEGKLETFFEKLENGDTALLKVWDDYLNHLAIHINNLHMLMDCNIIIGGYVGGFLSPYLNALREKVQGISTFHEDGSFIQACTYRVEASALGSALLFIEAFIDKV